MKIPIVDKDDKIIGSKERTNIAEDDIYRVSAAWLITKNDEVLMARRSPKKKNLPGIWSPSVAGTVEGDETYDENIVKEVFEEVGLEHLDLQKVQITFVQEDHRQFFCQWYCAIVQKSNINYSKTEIEEVAWVPLSKLLTDIHKNPEQYIPTIQAHLQVLVHWKSTLSRK